MLCRREKPLAPATQRLVLHKNTKQLMVHFIHQKGIYNLLLYLSLFEVCEFSVFLQHVLINSM